MKTYRTLGRRKSAVAQMYIEQSPSPKDQESISGSSVFLINKKTIFQYFQNDFNSIESLQLLANHLKGIYKIKTHVSGGGLTAQKQAICLALARGICLIDKQFPKKKGFLTQDSRVKERRKYGLKKARKAPQYSKR
uniref:Small ribosomal subunit protein uS9c n=1 Tax=Caulerpa lentillifera TaxID=148947 RepID=A0A345HGY8_9CHLO|nr:30S ribosomal protein S9 [Caulerpa lentillifera]AXG75878.1 30S ribosomal protein S9 [Caulerpa lentillifera]QKS32302.1 30S ribosomal protein S9 [Caulerpa lentillifera]QUV75691.1 ribosomal protein S9 [Caulerpa lentillifera]